MFGHAPHSSALPVSVVGLLWIPIEKAPSILPLALSFFGPRPSCAPICRCCYWCSATPPAAPGRPVFFRPSSDHPTASITSLSSGLGADRKQPYYVRPHFETTNRGRIETWPAVTCTLIRAGVPPLQKPLRSGVGQVAIPAPRARRLHLQLHIES